MRWLRVFLILFFSNPLLGKQLQLSIGAEEAILMNASTGQVLYEKASRRSVYPASVTKIATALYALHKYPTQLDRELTAERESLASISPQAKRQSNYRSPPYWLETDGTHIGIKKGEQFSLYDLLHAVLIGSANDAANVIAQAIGGTIPKFMEEVNQYLKQIGCTETSFNNPHGFHHPEHVTTAYDLALMAKEGLKNPTFRQIVSTVRYTCPQTNLTTERILNQTNQLLKNGPFYYPKAIGVKTGTTLAAGKNLVAAAKDGERELIAVALGYKGSRAELYQDVTKMFETAFKEPKMRRILFFKGEQKLTVNILGAKTLLKTYLTEDVSYDFYPSEETPLKVAVCWEIPNLPISARSCVGKLRITDNKGNFLKEVELHALAEVRASIWHHLKMKIMQNKRAFKLLVGVTSLSMLFLVGRRLKKKRA